MVNGDRQSILERLVRIAPSRELIFAILIGGLFTACAPAPPPPAPSSSSVSNTDRNRDRDSDDDADRDRDRDRDDSDPVDTTPLQLGAQIGDEQMKKAVSDCTGKGNFYSRKDEGKCTTQKLAKVECTVEGLKKTMSQRNRKAFEERIARPDYKDFEIDQCVACDGRNRDADACNKTDGTVVTGTRIYFARVANDVVEVQFQTIERSSPSSGSSGN